MREKKKRHNRIPFVWCTGLLVSASVMGQVDMTAYAKDVDIEMDAWKLPVNEKTYDIQVSLENEGADWEGTVRLMVEDYVKPTAYDTTISLPEGSKKQFVVQIPINSIDDSDGTVTVTLLDKKGEKCDEESYYRLLRDNSQMLNLGILSDDYSSLTYLDMGGEELYYYGESYPIKLTEINQENLVDSLDSLDFLVIDTYDTEALTDEEEKAIEDWNYDGGVLVFGTGQYGEDTLGGISYVADDVECVKVYKPGEISQSYDDLDMTQFHTAELYDHTGNYDEQYYWNCITRPFGDGAIGIVTYSFTEVAEADNSFYENIEQPYFVRNVLDCISNEATIRYNYTSSDMGRDLSDYMGRCLHTMGSLNSTLSFGVLKFLVVAYVIFVGPILYIILRCIKKREAYWLAVPVTTVLATVLIFLTGRGFEVVNTKVYSVTTQNLNGADTAESYLYCFDADKDEWSLKLKEEYLHAGSFRNDNYYYGDEDTYYHHVVKEGDRISVGIAPDSNFEDSYFQATREAENRGGIELNNVQGDLSGFTGSITNTTDVDFQYYAVVMKDAICVYEGLNAGESVDLSQDVTLYAEYSRDDIWYLYLYDFLEDRMREQESQNDIKEMTALSALGVGVFDVYSRAQGDLFVVGVTDQGDTVFDDECSEMAFGCYYVIQ